VGALGAEVAAVLGTLLAAVVVKTDITEVATAARFAVEVYAAAAVPGVGKFAAAAIVVTLDGKATSEFPDRSSQKPFASVRVARRTLPSALVR
jgi:hypothetical protein